MDFPLPIRSGTTVDYFTPLHVDTNIEYTLDMEKFPELTDPLHYWKPALVIDSHSYSPCDMSFAVQEVTSSSLDLAMSENHEELLDLIDIYAIHDLQGDDLDFGFVDLAPSSSQTVLATTGIYQESPLTCPSVDSVMSSPHMDDSGFVSETDEDVDHQSIPAETVLPCQETRRGRKRRRCAPASIEHITVYKRRKIRVSDDRDL